MVALCVLLCVCSCANTAVWICVQVTMESTSHIFFSERWGISTLFHVGTTDQTTFSCSARGSQRVQDVMFGYFSELNISTHSCCCTLNFTCLREVLFAEENIAELGSDPRCCSHYVRSTHSQFNASHHRIMNLLSFSLLSMNISSIHRQTQSDRKRKVKMNAELGSVLHMTCQTILVKINAVLLINQTSKIHNSNWFIVQSGDPLCIYIPRVCKLK